MRLARSTSLALLTVVTALTMAGCSDKRADPGASAADINTNNYFTEGQSLRIFNPETSQSVQVDTFDTGSKQLVNFDTDVNKQGFEYTVYAKDGRIYIKAHEKNGALPQAMVSTQSHICGLYARKSAVLNETSSAISDSLLIQDLYIVDVVTNADPDCDPMTSQYHEVDFSVLNPASANSGVVGWQLLRWKAISSAFVLGTMLKNYRPIVVKDPETDEFIRWGYIGYDVRSKTVQFYNQSARLIWQTKINPIESNNKIPEFFQASEDLVLIQHDQDVYVRNIPDLYVLGQEENLQGGELSSDSAIGQLFYIENDDDLVNLVDLELESADDTHPVSVQSDGKNFAVKDGHDLHYYDADNSLGFLNTPVYQASNDVTDFEYSIFPDSPSRLLINNIFIDSEDDSRYESLDTLTTDSLEISNLAYGEDVQYEAIDNVLYINTFKQDIAPSWQAHRIVTPINLPNSKSTYELSMFVFAEDRRTQNTYKLMLQATETTESGELVSPRIGPFSPTQQTGIYEGNVFGTINGNVQTSNLPDDQNFVMNNIYGGFFTQTGDTTNLYYFNLNDPKDSLSLMY